jgi:hypothetical protein
LSDSERNAKTGAPPCRYRGLAGSGRSTHRLCLVYPRTLHDKFALKIAVGKNRRFYFAAHRSGSSLLPPVPVQPRRYWRAPCNSQQIVRGTYVDLVHACLRLNEALGKDGIVPTVRGTREARIGSVVARRAIIVPFDTSQSRYRSTRRKQHGYASRGRNVDRSSARRRQCHSFLEFQSNFVGKHRVARGQSPKR